MDGAMGAVRCERRIQYSEQFFVRANERVDAIADNNVDFKEVPHAARQGKQLTADFPSFRPLKGTILHDLG